MVERRHLMWMPALALLAGGAALLHAQAPQPRPTFRSDINYVELPVRVLDGRGVFIRDLQQADFEIFRRRQTARDRGVQLCRYPVSVAGPCRTKPVAASSPH